MSIEFEPVATTSTYEMVCNDVRVDPQARVRLEVPGSLLVAALEVAMAFGDAFPQRVGRLHGVVYSITLGDRLGRLYAYRTEGGLVVVRSA